MTITFTSEALIPTENLLPIQTEQADQKAFVFYSPCLQSQTGDLSLSDITTGLLRGNCWERLPATREFSLNYKGSLPAPQSITNSFIFSIITYWIHYLSGLMLGARSTDTDKTVSHIQSWEANPIYTFWANSRSLRKSTSELQKPKQCYSRLVVQSDLESPTWWSKATNVLGTGKLSILWGIIYNSRSQTDLEKERGLR